MAAGDKAKKELEITERRKLVASLLTRKIDQIDIAAQIKKAHPDWDVSQPTISRDIKWLKQQWLEDSKQSVEDWKATELAELDEMERDCALQFSSKKSPEWIRVRLSLKERRAKLLGLDAPTKQEVSGDGIKAYINIDMDKV